LVGWISLGRDSITGKRRYHNHTIRGVKKDAQKYLNAKLREIDLGTYIEPTRVSVNEYLDQWLESAARPRVREATHVWYRDLLKHHVRPSIGNERLSAIRPLDVQTIYTKMQQRGLSAKTIRYVHVVLSSALKQAVKWRMLTHNPGDSVELPRVSRREMAALSPEETSRFLKAAKKDKWGVLFNLAVTTGMRPEEYLGLQWKDIDLESGIVTVQRAVIWRSKIGWYFSEPKTTRSRRSVPVPASVVKALVNYKSKQARHRLKVGQEYQDNDPVFATTHGTPLMRRNLVRRHFKPILKNAKLDKSIRLYDLRHTCATLLLAANENPKVVSERLGHASIAITMDTYSHVLPSMQRAASDKLESMLYTKHTGGTQNKVGKK
jgi:integrase